MRKLSNKEYDQMIKELWSIRNPHIEFDEKIYRRFKRVMSLKSNKPKMPKPLVFNLPSEKAFFELSTARNRNLINIEEQNKLRNTVVAFFGLSVGSHAAITWIMESRAGSVKIVDPDIISATNLNRIRSGWESVGKKKVEVVHNIISEINPFCEVQAFQKGTPDEIRRIFDSDPKINILVDEVDDFEAKILFRKLAREKRIPVVSAADVGDNVILDVERYDIDPQPKLFLGRVPNIDNINFSHLPERDRKKLIINLIGFEKNSERMIDSLFSIGGSIVTWPQLGATATVAGGLVATTLKKIVLGEKVASGRYYLSLDDLLVQDFNSLKRKNERAKKISQIKSLLKK
jgi:molybdopterin/thiamine biosynthesis adenylyltransferase